MDQVLNPSHGLQEIADEAAIAFIAQAAKNGAISPRMFCHEGRRIAFSVDPSGPGGALEHHVSVSERGRSVPITVASTYARKLIPGYAGFDEACVRDAATHIWVHGFVEAPQCEK